MTQLISTIRQKTELQAQINDIMQELDSSITSITRIGAVIIAEINNFKSPGNFQAFTGLEPSIYQS